MNTKEKLQRLGEIIGSLNALYVEISEELPKIVSLESVSELKKTT